MTEIRTLSNNIFAPGIAIIVRSEAANDLEDPLTAGACALELLGLTSPEN
jgi:hypothetical protein